MRKVITGAFVSLDGVMQAPGGPKEDPTRGFDCHWTSLNFWNDPPDDRYVDTDFVIQTVREQYEQVAPPYQLGDLVFLFKSPTAAIHSCAYIADDIVFTKNGASVASPWTLERLSDTIAYYGNISTSLEVKVFRRKDLK